MGSELAACGAGLKNLSSPGLQVSLRLCLEALSSEVVLVIQLEAHMLIRLLLPSSGRLFFSVNSSLE